MLSLQDKSKYKRELKVRMLIKKNYRFDFEISYLIWLSKHLKFKKKYITKTPLQMEMFYVNL